MARNNIPLHLGEEDAELNSAFGHFIEARDNARQDDGRGDRHVKRRMLAWRYYIRRLVTEQPFLRKAVPGTIVSVNTSNKTCTAVVDGERGEVGNIKYYPPTKPPSVGQSHNVHFEVKLPTKTMQENSKIEEGERWIKLYASRWLYWVVASGNTSIIRRQAWPIDPNADPEKDIETLKTITRPLGLVAHRLTATAKDQKLWFDAYDQFTQRKATHLWSIKEWGKGDLTETVIGVDIPDFPQDSGVDASPPVGERFFLMDGDHSPGAEEVILLGHYQTRKWIRAYTVDIGHGGSWSSGEWEHIPINSSNGTVWNRGQARRYRPRIGLFDAASGVTFNKVVGSFPLWNENENSWAFTKDNGNKIRVVEWRYGDPFPASGSLTLPLDISRPFPDQILKTPVKTEFEVLEGNVPLIIPHPQPYTPPNTNIVWTPIGKTALVPSGDHFLYFATFAKGSQPFPSEEYIYTDHQLYRVNLTTGESKAMVFEDIPLTKLISSSWDGQDLIAATKENDTYFSIDGGEHWALLEMIVGTDNTAIKLPYTTMIFEGPS